MLSLVAAASAGGSSACNTMFGFGMRWLWRSQPIVSSSRPIIPILVVVDALKPRYITLDGWGLGRRYNHRRYFTGTTVSYNNDIKILEGERRRRRRRRLFGVLGLDQHRSLGVLYGGRGGEIEESSSSKSSSSDDDIPYREYGYRSTPFCWDELVTIVNGNSETGEEQNLAKLCRSVEEERRYGEAKKEILQNYESIVDHVLYTKFGIERQYNTTSEKFYVRLPPQPSPPAIEVSSMSASSSSSSSILDATRPNNFKTMVLLPNEFPYFVGDSVEHWVLWKLYDEISQHDIDDAIRSLQKNTPDPVDETGPDMDDVLWWENPPHLKSLPQINHVHILVRLKKEVPLAPLGQGGRGGNDDD